MATMNQFTTLVRRALRCHYNIKFYSQPALGKDTLLDQLVAEEQAADGNFVHEVWDGGTMAPTDLVMSMPDMEAQMVRKLVDAGIPNAHKTPNARGIIRVGEMGLMGIEASRGLQKLWNHEDIGGKFRVPSGVIFVGLSNRVSDKSGVQTESRANHSRFESHVLEYDPDYALQIMKGYHERVAAFAIRFPTEIDNYEDVFENDKRKSEDMTYQEGKTYGIWANLRSWDRVSRKLQDADATGIPLYPDEIARNVGNGIAAKFEAFCKMLDHLASLEQIVAQPNKATVPTKMDEQYALSTMLALLVNKDNFVAISVYMRRYAEELQVVFFKLMNERLNKAKDGNKSAINATKEYRTWITSKHIMKLLMGASEA